MLAYITKGSIIHPIKTTNGVNKMKKQMNFSAIFKNAHALAKQLKGLFINYRAAFSVALSRVMTAAWSEVKEAAAKTFDVVSLVKQINGALISNVAHKSLTNQSTETLATNECFIIDFTTNGMLSMTLSLKSKDGETLKSQRVTGLDDSMAFLKSL